MARASSPPSYSRADFTHEGSAGAAGGNIKKRIVHQQLSHLAAGHGDLLRVLI
jgi:hypothetical protein